MNLIDKDALAKMICKDQCDRKRADCDSDCEMVAYVTNAPTVDAVPVVHGRWKWLTREEAKKYAALGIVTDSDNWICSICGKHGTGSLWAKWNKYCPNCGAKMDGERKDETD